LTLSRSAALADRDGRAGTDGTRITDGSCSSAALTGRPSTTLVRTKIVASATPPQQFTGRYVTITRRIGANSAVLVKSLVYLSLFILVSAIALIYKYLLFAVTYVTATLYPVEFDRDVVIDALNEIEKDSQLND
jgi:hypothetical protein